MAVAKNNPLCGLLEATVPTSPPTTTLQASTIQGNDSSPALRRKRREAQTSDRTPEEEYTVPQDLLQQAVDHRLTRLQVNKVKDIDEKKKCSIGLT